MQIDPELIMLLPVWYAAFLFSLTFHEAAHAWVGKLGGDETAQSQVTLYPVPHIAREPFGTVLVPIITYFLQGGGWMIGWASAPYDPEWAKRYPKRAAWMAAAGPLSNLLLVLITAVVIRVGLNMEVFATPEQLSFERIIVSNEGEMSALSALISVLFSVNLVLFIFNLIPFAPLDGYAMVPLFLNKRLTDKWFELAGSLGLMGLLIAWIAFDRIFTPIFIFALRLLYSGG